MDPFLYEGNKEKKSVSKILVGALLVAAAMVAGGVWLLTFQPTMEEQKQKQLEGSYFEGSPEFDSYTNNLIISTDMNRTTQSPLGLGTILMSIHGDIRNKGDKTIDGLEVKVSVVDTFGKVIKDKKVLIVPNQESKLEPGQTIHVFVPMDGFKKEDDRANVRWKVSAIRFE